MSVKTVRTILTDRVWALLEANETVAEAVLPGNRAKFGTQRGWFKARMQNKTPADYPQLIVTCGAGNYAGNGAARQYADKANPHPTGRVKELQQTLTIVLTHRDANSATNDPIDAAVLEAIDAGGVGLGLMLSPFGFSSYARIDWTTDYTAQTAPNGLPPQQGGQKRQQTIFNVPMVVRWQGDTFPTQTT